MHSTRATTRPNPWARSIARSVEAPVVTTSSTIATFIPGDRFLVPSSHCAVPCFFGSFRMMNAGIGFPRRALVSETAVTIGSAPSVIPPTA